MTVTRPYRRNCRPFADGDYTEGGRSRYIEHPMYAKAPEHYVRAFLLLQKDLIQLFDYVEPADKNLSTYSYRIHALLLRAAVEVEANCKAILRENGYTKATLTMVDYRKLERTHLLSAYETKLPQWTGDASIRRPFSAWCMGGPLPWYQAYNAVKHDRHSAFEAATFEHLIDAWCAVLVLLTAQFNTHDFSPGDILLSVGGPSDGMESAIGGFLRVRLPHDWPAELRYDFSWDALKGEPDPFQTIDYSEIE